MTFLATRLQRTKKHVASTKLLGVFVYMLQCIQKSACVHRVGLRERERGPAAVAALYLLPRHCALHRICMNNRLPPCGPPIYNRYTVDECNIEDADYLILSKAVQCEREGEEEMSWDYIIWLLLNKNDGKWFDRVMVYHASPGVFISTRLIHVYLAE